ncbi:PAS domain S-box protein [Leptolyngbya sp. AN02str]|uniref:PAS domain S-box protein n=1 Tax=Leptolyngbya sp. AN02str TaxID=3423363 RepID=UPI003D3216D4
MDKSRSFVATTTPEQILEGMEAIAQRIHWGAHLDLVLNEAAEAVHSLLQVERVLVCCAQPIGFVVMAEASTEVSTEANHSWLGQTWAALGIEAIQSDGAEGAAIAVSAFPAELGSSASDLASHGDLDALTGETPGVLADSMVQALAVAACLAAPIVRQGELWGWVVALHQHQTRAWRSLDRKLIQYVALQLGIAAQQQGHFPVQPLSHASVPAGSASAGYGADTSAGAALEQTLRDQERRLTAIAANLPGGIYRAVYDADGTFLSLFLSDGYRDLLGCDPQELMQHPERLVEFIHPDDWEMFHASVQTASRLQTADHLEYRFVAPNGRVCWVRDHARFHQGEQGELIVDGVAIDISDRKLAEAHLADHQAALKQIIDSSASSIYVKDPEGRFLIANQSAADVHGTTVAAMLGKYEVEFNANFTMAQLEEYWAINRAVMTSRQPQQHIQQIQTASGEWRWYQTTIGPFVGVDDQVRGVIGNTVDITNMKQVEAALQAKQHFLDKVLTANPNAIYVYDLIAQRNVYANRTLIEGLGYTLADMQKLNHITLQDFVHPDDYPRLEQHLQHCATLLDNQVIEIEYRCQHVNGDWRWFLSRDTPFSRTTDGVVGQILGTVQDITERKRIEERLRQSEQWLNQHSHQSPSNIYTVVQEPDGRVWFEYISAAVQTIHEFTSEDVLANAYLVLDQIHPEDRAGYAAAVAHSMQTMGQFAYEWRVITPSGKVKWLQANSQPVHRFNGAIAWHGVVQDITDRKLAEATLLQSESRYRHVVQTQTDFILRSHADTTITFANAALCYALGCTLDQVVGQKWIDFAEPGDLQRILQQIAALTPDAPTFMTENRDRRGDSHIGWTQWINQGIFNLEGELVEIQSVGRDITALKQVEAALRESEERLRLALEAAQMGSWDWNILTQELVVSENMERLMGIAPGCFDGRMETVLAMIHPEDRPRMIATLRHSIRHQQEYEIEFRYFRPDGSLNWATSKGNVRVDHTGLPVRLLGINLDITERKHHEAVRKQAEQQLQESELRFRLVFEAAGLGIALCQGPDYKAILSNSYLQEFLGYSGEELRNLDLQDYTHPDDYDVEAGLVAECFAGARDRYQIEKRYVRKDGSVCWGLLNVAVIRNDVGIVSFGFAMVQDITQRKQAELALRQRMEREQSLGLVVSTIRQSLDLDTILTTAAREVAHLLQLDQAAIVQYIPERRCWRHITAYQHDSHFPNGIGLEIPDDNNPIADQLKRREVVTVVDSRRITDAVNRRLAQSSPGAWLLVPIVVGDSIWGSFTLRVRHPIEQWPSEQIELAQVLADQLAIAIHQSALYHQVQLLNASLEEQVQERTNELQQALNFESLLKRITDKVRDSLDEAQILQTAVKELAVNLGLCFCDTSLYDLEQKVATICYEYVPSQLPSAKGQTIGFSELPEVFAQLLNGTCSQFCLIPTGKLPAPIKNDGPEVLLVCSLKDDQGVLGDMWLSKPAHSLFSELEVRLVEQVANQCAIALRQTQLYQAVQLQVLELERLNRLKDDFLSTVSHEMRTPMSHIQMATQMLESSLEQAGVWKSESSMDQGNQISRYLKLLREEGQREMELINDLLDLTRLDAGTEPLTLNTIDLQYFLPHLAEPFIERVQTQQQQLVIDIPETLPSLTTDLTCLERIFTELLHNACKYTPAQEVITLTAQASETCLDVFVSNSGVHIPPSEGDRIFDKFYRIPSHDPWKQSGTGLGLALVKKLVEHLGATIRVQIQERLITFILSFPLHSHQPPEEPTQGDSCTLYRAQ